MRALFLCLFAYNVIGCLPPGDERWLSTGDSAMIVADELKAYWQAHGQLPSSAEEIRQRVISKHLEGYVNPRMLFSWQVLPAKPPFDKEKGWVKLRVEAWLPGEDPVGPEVSTYLGRPEEHWEVLRQYDTKLGSEILLGNDVNLSHVLAAMICDYREVNKESPRSVRDLSKHPWYAEFKNVGGPGRFTFRVVKDGNVGRVLVKSRKNGTTISYPSQGMSSSVAPHVVEVR
jgi:hypothetical protein